MDCFNEMVNEGLAKTNGSEDEVRPNCSYRGYSSAGRATALQAVGQEFEPPYLHQRGMDTPENGVYLSGREDEILGIVNRNARRIV